MSEEQVSTMAKLYAERLMSGDSVSESEMRVILAGLMLSVDKLANMFRDMQRMLWSEAKMRETMAEEIEKHCAENKRHCLEELQTHSDEETEQESRKGFAAWCGRVIRSFLIP